MNKYYYQESKRCQMDRKEDFIYEETYQNFERKEFKTNNLNLVFGRPQPYDKGDSLLLLLEGGAKSSFMPKTTSGLFLPTEFTT